MPVSGRPTNSALLKTTHGSSESSTKLFQKSASGPVAIDAAAAVSGARIGTLDTNSVTEIARRTAKTITVTNHSLVDAAWDAGAGGPVSACATGASTAFSAVRG